MYTVHISDQVLRYACSSECVHRPYLKRTNSSQGFRSPIAASQIEHFRSRAVVFHGSSYICKYDFLSELSKAVLDSISKSIAENLFATYF